MADASSLPAITELMYFQWSTPTAPNPRLSAPIDSDDTTIAFTSAPLDEDGSVITAPFIMGVKNSNSYVESIYCPNGADGASGLSATGCIRGIDLAGLDFTVGDTDNADSHGQDSPVFCNITAVLNTIMVNTIQGVGDMATGGDDLIIGDGTDTDKTIKAAIVAGATGFIRYNPTTSKAQYSNDGAVWNDIDDVTAGSLVVITGADTTPGNLDTKITIDSDTMTKTVTSPGGDERLELAAVGGLADIVDDVTATAAEINNTIDGTTATAANLNTLTGGVSSNADALHTHSDIGVFSGTAGEAIDGSSTPQAVVIGHSTGTHAITIWETASSRSMSLASLSDLNMGEQDSNQMVAQSFTYEDTAADTVTLNKIRVAVQKNNGPGDNFRVFLYDDSSDTPGSLVTSGTGTTVTGASLSSNAYQWTEFTWAVDPSITPGDKYWIVFDRSGANDGTNYYELGYTTNASYSGHGYSVFDDVGGTWGAEHGTRDICMQIIVDADFSGDVLEADANDYTRFNAVGFTADNVAGGASINVQPSGVVSGFTGLSVGERYYLSTTSGEITASPSASEEVGLIPIGTAVSTTELLLQPGQKMIRWETSTMDLWEPTAAYTADFFFETGFKPTRIQWYVDFVDNSTMFDIKLGDSFLAVDTVRGLSLSDLAAGHVMTGGTATLQDLDTGTPTISVIEVFNTGVTMRITGNSNDFVAGMRFVAFGN